MVLGHIINDNMWESGMFYLETFTSVLSILLLFYRTSWISTMGMMSIPWGYWPHRRSLSAASEQGGRAFAAELSLRFPPPCGTSVSFSTCRPLGRVRQSTIASAGKTLLPRISNTSTGGNHYWWGNMHTFLDVHRCIYAPNGTVKKCTKL